MDKDNDDASRSCQRDADRNCLGVLGPDQQPGRAATDTDAAPAPLDRREALQRLGRYSGYVAPTLLTLLLPDGARGQIGSPPPPPPSSAGPAAMARYQEMLDRYDGNRTR
jgi:hypothetical protein